MLYTDSISRSSLKAYSSFLLSFLCSSPAYRGPSSDSRLAVCAGWSLHDPQVFRDSLHFLLGFHATTVIIHPKCRGFAKDPYASLPFPRCLFSFLRLLVHNVAACTLCVCKRLLSTEDHLVVITQFPIPLSQLFSTCAGPEFSDKFFLFASQMKLLFFFSPHLRNPN